MRVVFLLLFIAGVVLAGADWLAPWIPGHDIGRWRLYDAGSGPQNPNSQPLPPRWGRGEASA